MKTLIVIAVNAKTEKTSSWDKHARGPSTLAVLGATRGTPMGSFSNETVDRIQEQTEEIDEARGAQPIDERALLVGVEDASLEADAAV